MCGGEEQNGGCVVCGVVVLSKMVGIVLYLYRLACLGLDGSSIHILIQHCL